MTEAAGSAVIAPEGLKAALGFELRCPSGRDELYLVEYPDTPAKTLAVGACFDPDRGALTWDDTQRGQVEMALPVGGDAECATFQLAGRGAVSFRRMTRELYDRYIRPFAANPPDFSSDQALHRWYFEQFGDGTSAR